MISLKNFEKHYKNFDVSLSLDIPEGVITGLIGKNGAGKTTTIKAILGLIKCDNGSAKLFGKESVKLSPEDKENIGVTLADAGFMNILNIEDIIKILRKSYSQFDEKFFREQCEHHELPMKKAIKDFSTGMNAKLRVLSAISHKAKLLILDEPTAGLDISARNEVLDMLRDYMAEDSSRSILISSHISSDLEGLCDDIYMIDKGKIVLHEETDIILSSYGIIKVSEEQYEKLDKTYILKTKKEHFGYSCLTNEKQFYTENYPDAAVENGKIDDIILMMGEK